MEQTVETGETAALPITDKQTIQVTAQDMESLLSTLLDKVFRARGDISPEQEAQSEQSPEGEIIGFRAFGRDSAELVWATVTAALEEADSQNVSVSAVEIGGVMTIPEGVRCWGYLTTKPRIQSDLMMFIAHSPTMIAVEDGLSAQVELATDRS